MSCPMGFGELNIPSSRAFWDDCDEDEPGNPNVVEKLQLKYAEGVADAATRSDMLLLIEGSDIADFAEKALLNETSSKICDIPAKRSSLHRLTDGQHSVVVLAILEEDLTSSGEVLQLLQPYAQLAQQVVTVTIKAKVDYKSENIAKVRDEIVFWRGINAQLKHVRELQPPNFIAGVAAGVASWCDNSNMAVSSYVAYVDNVALDAQVSEPVLKLLQELGLRCASTYTPKRKDDSHLYS